MIYNNFLLPYVFALRMLSKSLSQNYVGFLIRLCFAGITIGSASLCLTLMIMCGFEQEICQKARGMCSQAVISTKNQQSIAWQGTPEFLQHLLPQLIENVSATSVSHVVIDHGQNFHNLLLKAVDTKTFCEVSDLSARITPRIEETGPNAKPKTQRNVNLHKILHTNQVIIGYKLAQSLNVGLRDELKVLLPEPSGKKNVKLREVKVVVAGFLDVGFNEFDAGTLICSLELFWEFFGNSGQVENILIKFRKNMSNRTFWCSLIEKLKSLLPWAPDQEGLQASQLAQQLDDFKVQAWKELYPALVSSLRLEKYAMFFVLLLVSIVAIMNMISLLIVQVQAKRKDIAILRTVGFSNRFVQQIFISFGLALTFFASTSGLLLAYSIGLFFTHILPIQLPDAYLVATLPFDLASEHLILVFIATMVVGFFATWFPAKHASNLNIIKVLRGHSS